MSFSNKSQTGSSNKSDVAKKEASGSNLAKLSLAALGVVFGDIGTSPLYAIRECFHGKYGIAVTNENILGVLSLMFWALFMIVTFKYLIFILRADNNGEGGVLALTALLKQTNIKNKSRRLGLVGVGLFAACLLYGDGMITPAISVLSAVEGIRIITPVFKPYIIPLTIVILAGFFFLQSRGTARVGSLFGPVIFTWFLILAVLGTIQIFNNPKVLFAVFPWHGITFLVQNKLHGFVVLGAVFLVVTGAEAMYADMGHFGKRPIRITWLVLVFPALVLNYFGQGALLMLKPEQSHHPFYALVPTWALIPMVLLATVATIIASQAVITGSFSLTRQAIQLGYLPRLRVSHTSAAHIGQIYIAPVNWLLMICTIGLVIGFQSSSKLAAAYGVAVTSTMLITTMLFFVVARRKWGWGWLGAGALMGLFFLIDIPFFFANISKIFHGAWFPLAIGAAFFTLMLTWKKGRSLLAEQLSTFSPSVEEFTKSMKLNPPQKVKGQAIYLTGNPDRIPQAIVQNLHHNKIMHSNVAILHLKTEDIPRVPNLEKIEVEKLSGGFYRIIAHHGFMETPKIETILALARDQGVEIKFDTASFFLGQEKLVIGKKPKMGKWRSNLFRFLSKNAMDASSYFGIPSNQVIEVGVQFEL
ncbi:MAG: potassium transporter Kup [Pseudomonadota bacterium]